MSTPNPKAIEAAAIAIYVCTAADDSGPFEAFTERKKDHYRAKARRVLEVAAPFIAAQAKAEGWAQAFQAVRDACDHTPDQVGDYGRVELEGYEVIGTRELAALEGAGDGMDWIRYTATDYANQIQQAKAEALREAADDLLAEKCGDNYAPDYCETCRAVETLRARAATIEGKSE